MPDRLTHDRDCHRDYCGCPKCREWEEWHEARHALDLLAAADAEVRQAKPATPSEWAAFFDAEFPRAGGVS